MTLEVFIILLPICAVITSLFTEALKELFDVLHIKYASNIMVLPVALVVGIIGAMLYYNLGLVQINKMNCIMAVFLGLSNWVGAMVGYDKVIQAISQIRRLGGDAYGSNSSTD